jgi:hypothetical protein
MTATGLVASIAMRHTTPNARTIGRYREKPFSMWNQPDLEDRYLSAQPPWKSCLRESRAPRSRLLHPTIGIYFMTRTDVDSIAWSISCGTARLLYELVAVQPEAPLEQFHVSPATWA